MKKTIILGFTTTVIALASFTASAGTDDKYPAANFQPKVVYIDKDVVKEAAKASPKCPDQNSTAAAPAEKATEFDPKYPAANFVPKVIYP